MMQQIVPKHRNQDLREEGMLFVRTEGILHTLVKAPILAVGLIALFVVIPFQNSFGSTRSLDLIIYSDGSTHVFSEIEANPFEPDLKINLFGNTIDNLVTVGENGFLLSSEINNNTATVETFGSSTITLDYDIHDLISKEGRVWTFSMDAPTDFTVLMPQNSVIVGMSTIPLNMELFEEQTKLFLPSGPSQIDYIFGTTTDNSNPIVTPNPPETGFEFDNSYIILAGAVVGAGAVGAFLLKRAKTSPSKTDSEKPLSTSKSESKILKPELELETIFNLRPDLREDDKNLVTFIFNNGGQAYESELRKKFLQPRTTMWRAVKRLERQGIVEIEKKELQNLVKLVKNMEEEE